MHSTDVVLQVHAALQSDCQTVGVASVKFSEVLDYPTNKLHGSAVLKGAKPSSKDTVVGNIEYWFKLHTHDTKRITNFR